MSEYQYYEWQTVDRPLTAEERSAVGKLSSHIEVRGTSAWVEYHWGNFKHDPVDVLTRYFDAFLYYANWGNELLAFRIPKRLLDAALLQPYMWTDCADLTPKGEYYILSFAAPEQEPPDWDEDAVASLGAMTALRSDILQGDLRSVYLGWLMGAVADAHNDDGEFDDYLDEDDDEEEEDEDAAEFGTEIEPAVPPGLGQLSGALEAFVQFFRIDPFLVAAAAQESAAFDAADTAGLEAQLTKLPADERDAFLRRLLAGERNLQVLLRQRLAELAGTPQPASARGRRTVRELLATAEQLRAEAARRASAAAEARRVQDLQAFAPQAAHAWRTVEEEIERKHASAYDKAVALLVKLRDLARYQNEMPAFQERLQALLRRYSTLRGFVDRVRKARL